EDVAEAGGDHGPEAVVHQRPDRVLARRAGAEVGPGHEDRGAVVARLVEHEVRVFAPGAEQALAEAVPADPLEPHGRDDLVGVDVAAPQRHGPARVGNEWFHDRSASLQVGGGGQAAGDGGGGGDGGRDQVSAPALALAAFEVPVGGGRGA